MGGRRCRVNKSQQAWARTVAQGFKPGTGSLPLLSARWAKDKGSSHKEKAGEYREASWDMEASQGEALVGCARKGTRLENGASPNLA